MGLYVYCFIDAVEEVFAVGAVGNPTGEVYSVQEGPVAAVVSELQMGEIDPTRRNLLGHQRVLSIVRGLRQTIIPMCFGTIVEDEVALRGFVQKHGEDIARLLRELAGCVEMGIKVLWDTNRALRSIAQNDPEVGRERETLMNMGAGAPMDKKVQIGKLIERRLHERRESYARHMMEFLSAAACGAKKDEPGDDATVLNASFLIRADEEPQFERRVEELDTHYESYFKIKYTGPFPPYNFVELRFDGDSLSAAV